jgi:membrane protease YdiL (CAAX protease family)
MDAQRLLQQLVGPLQRSPGLRGTVYLGTAAVLLQTVGGWYRQKHQDYPTRVVLTHLTVLPLGVAVTAAGLLLEGRSPAELLPTPEERRQLALGFGLGTLALLTSLGLARAKGWVSAPRWGWEEAPLGDVLRSAALSFIGDFAIAWNEEQVFRGYGFDTLQASIGTPGAVLVLVPLFAAGHPLRPFVLAMQGIAGLMFTGQRLATGSIWLGVGHHWAWNAMQSAVFGPPEVRSLRPLIVDGPPVWVGRAGHPEPGLLTAFVDLLILALVGAVWWRRKRQAGKHQEKD